MPVNPPKIPRELAQSPVFGRDAKIHPGLARPGTPFGPVLAFAGLVLLGVVTFLSLSNAREAQKPAPAPQRLAQVPVPAAAVIDATLPAPPPPAQPQNSATDYRAPAMVVDFSQAPAAQAPSGVATAAAGASVKPPDDKLTADEKFSAQMGLGSVDVAHATQLHNMARIAPQGTVIPAILETAVNSDLPGFVRAVVSRDIRGFDGTTVLIPRGTKLIGQYKSAVALSQTRAFVVWSRLLTPDGISVDISSPATDQLGRGGLDGETDTHFFERFGSAILLSVMSAGLDRLADRTADTAIIIGSSQQASQVANIALQKQIDIPVTIKVPQGTPLQVFVTRDLDFSNLNPASSGSLAAKP
jgi:type IV secretion system protein VirB10